MPLPQILNQPPPNPTLSHMKKIILFFKSVLMGDVSRIDCNIGIWRPIFLILNRKCTRRVGILWESDSPTAAGSTSTASKTKSTESYLKSTLSPINFLLDHPHPGLKHCHLAINIHQREIVIKARNRKLYQLQLGVRISNSWGVLCKIASNKLAVLLLHRYFTL